VHVGGRDAADLLPVDIGCIRGGRIACPLFMQCMHTACRKEVIVIDTPIVDPIKALVDSHLVALKPMIQKSEVRGAKVVCTVDKYAQTIFVATYRGMKKANVLLSESRKAQK